jgi:alpha-galactosidase
MFSAPLMLGCDIRDMSSSTKSIIANKDIIAIDQDTLGKQAYRVISRDGIDAWQKPLSGNRVAIAFLNRNSQEKSICATYKDLELKPEADYDVYDVWNHTKIKQDKGAISAILKSHECQVFVLSAFFLPLGHKN